MTTAVARTVGRLVRPRTSQPAAAASPMAASNCQLKIGVLTNVDRRDGKRPTEGVARGDQGEAEQEQGERAHR